MAVKYKDLKNKLELEPLNEKELEYINAAEKYIDSELISKFDNRQIMIDMNVFDFRYIPNNISMINDIKDTRKLIMRKELEKRYVSAGWDIKEEFTDSGFDYIILSGKK